MSATKRSDVRHENDFYATPAWCVRALLAEVPIPDGLWLDPCAGEGAIIEASGRDRWHAIELREECREKLYRACPRITISDFLSMPNPTPGGYAAIVTNPPYSLAEAFVRKSLEIAPVVAMLLRLNWLGSMKRAAFLRENQPSVYVLPRRPSFTGGGTDSCEYAWFVWRKYWAGNPEVRVLNPENCR
jgi:hypothetical protein